MPEFLKQLPQLLASLFGIGGSLFTNAQNVKMQQETNALNKALFLENRDYNSPANQVERLKDAGLNPDLMYSGGLGSSMSGNLPSIQSPSVQNPLSASDVANIRLANSQASKTDAETDIINIDKYFEYDLKQLEVAQANSNVKLTDSTVGLNEENMRLMVVTESRIENEIKQIQAQTAEANERILNLREDRRTALINNAFSEQSFTLRLQQIASQVDLTEAQVKEALMAAYNLRTQGELNDQQLSIFHITTAYLQAQVTQLDLSNSILGVDERIKTSNENFDSAMHKVNAVTDAIGNLVGSVASGFLGIGAGSRLLKGGAKVIQGFK